MQYILLKICILVSFLVQNILKFLGQDTVTWQGKWPKTFSLMNKYVEK